MRFIKSAQRLGFSLNEVGELLKLEDGVRRWALDVQARSNHNKAACALANKLARICYATLRDKEPFGEPTVRLNKKITRESFVMSA